MSRTETNGRWQKGKIVASTYQLQNLSQDDPSFLILMDSDIASKQLSFTLSETLQWVSICFLTWPSIKDLSNCSILSHFYPGGSRRLPYIFPFFIVVGPTLSLIAISVILVILNLVSMFLSFSYAISKCLHLYPKGYTVFKSVLAEQTNDEMKNYTHVANWYK